jgi:Dyp-type peroxidase family
MASDQVEPSQPTKSARLSDSIQAHLGRASSFADGKTRNWTLFFFFRILKKAEIARDTARLKSMMDATTDADRRSILIDLIDSMEGPILASAGVADQAKLDGVEDASGPAQAFRDWLNLLTTADLSGLTKTLTTTLNDAGIPISALTQNSDGDSQAAMELLTRFERQQSNDLLDWVSGLRKQPDQLFERQQILSGALKSAVHLLSNPAHFAGWFAGFADSVSGAGLRALSLGLSGICAYELLRHIAPAHCNAPATVRDESTARHPPQGWDPVPINLTFNYAGLKALQLDATTLASFPEAFKQGMAARAQLLGDTGPSAPEHWEGSLGLDCIHGYFTGGFLIGGEHQPAKASDWQTLRDDVRLFNERSPGRGTSLRLLLGAMFRFLGLEIVQIELGEDPSDVDQNGDVQRPAYRREHFGFRDGISQPFIDLELHSPPPGGGTPSRNRTWSPLAAGEIYLDRPDEDGNVPYQPLHPLLREGSTFLVFRKLEQDVAGFRAFLAKQRPADKPAQDRLASQFMGRWQNGTPLVLAPDAPLNLGSDPDGLLNDFLYAADDPKGIHCPLGAHARRTNPRDIGGTNDVRRHRILRRSIGYGGPLLPEGELGDGNKRGLLFVAANSRIDLQFEVVQAAWINRGELLGQAGLGRCPITGANVGGPSDAFLEAGAVAPVVGIPRFVITRGGDYFFAPGINALKAIAAGCKFPLPVEKVPYFGFSMGDAHAPALFDRDRLKKYAFAMLSGACPFVRVSLPSPIPKDPQTSPVVFAGRHADVCRVLSTGQNNGNIVYSVTPYREAGRRISRGYDLIIGTEPGSKTAAKHKRMHALLDEAWQMLIASSNLNVRLQQLIKRNIDATLRRCGPSGRIDLIHDLPSTMVYDIVAEIFGTPGPNWLTEMAVALQFGCQHVGELHPEWLGALKAAPPDNPGLATMQLWSILLFADIVGNYDHQQDLMALSLQAGSEFLNLLDIQLATARSRPTPTPVTMIQAFVALQEKYMNQDPPMYKCLDDYYGDVRMLLMELAGSAVAIIPTAFGSIMKALLDFGIDLSRLIPILLAPPNHPPGVPTVTDEGLMRLIYETSRLEPVFAVLMRQAAQDDVIGEETIKEGEWAAALVAAANMDGTVFDEPMEFSLAPFVAGPKRDLSKYLLFGAQNGPDNSRVCWGRDRLALLVLQECLKAAGRLQGLRKVAGASGELRKLAAVNVGLNARFTRALPDW